MFFASVGCPILLFFGICLYCSLEDKEFETFVESKKNEASKKKTTFGGNGFTDFDREIELINESRNMSEGKKATERFDSASSEEEANLNLERSLASGETLSNQEVKLKTSNMHR